jgi:recombination protein RecA
MKNAASTAPALFHPAPLAAQGVRRGLVAPDIPVAWRLDTFRGRLAEVSGIHACASLTLVFRLVLEAQRCAEPVVWISRCGSVFYPPDVAETGVDLGALAVVWAPGTRRAARAADHLLRSGGFGLVVLDVGADDRMPSASQTRLAGLAKKHDAALLCITEKENRRPSLGSLVSLRAEAARTDRAGDRFRCEVRVLKDKRRGPGWTHVEVCHGPDGLC